MFHKGRSKLFEIEKDTNFANRILALSMPSALVFIMLVALKLLPAGIGRYGLCPNHSVQHRVAFPDHL